MDPTDWLPFYPDQLPRRPRRQDDALAAQPPYSTALFPIPDVLASLTFFPTYPDQVAHHRVPRAESTVTTAAVISPAVAPVSWLPTYPSRVPHHRFATAWHQSVAEPPISVQMRIAQTLVWLPHYPDRVPHHRVPNPGGFSWTFAVAQTFVAGAAPCVDLALDTLSEPTLLQETLTVPMTLGDALTSSTLLAEAVC